MLKKYLNRGCLFQTKGFFFPSWHRGLGLEPRCYLSAVWHQGRTACVTGPSRDPRLMARTMWFLSYQFAGSGTSTSAAWKEKRERRKKKGEGRKEGRKVCITGREEVKQDWCTRLDCRTDHWLYFALCMVAENPNRNLSCFPHTLGEERNFFSSRFREGRIMCVLEGQCSLSHTADRRAAREMRNTIYPWKSLSRQACPPGNLWTSAVSYCKQDLKSPDYFPKCTASAGLNSFCYSL